jgi:hypothetical protein
MTLTGKKEILEEKPVLVPHFLTTNTTWAVLESYPGLRGVLAAVKFANHQVIFLYDFALVVGKLLVNIHPSYVMVLMDPLYSMYETHYVGGNSNSIFFNN